MPSYYENGISKGEKNILLLYFTYEWVSLACWKWRHFLLFDCEFLSETGSSENEINEMEKGESQSPYACILCQPEISHHLRISSNRSSIRIYRLSTKATTYTLQAYKMK